MLSVGGLNTRREGGMALFWLSLSLALLQIRAQTCNLQFDIDIEAGRDSYRGDIVITGNASVRLECRILTAKSFN